MLRIVFIGAGRLATHFATALHAAGHAVVQVYSRTQASAEALAAHVGAAAVSSISDVLTDADAYIVAVKDDVLPSLLPRLAMGRHERPFFHTAGSVPMSVFQGHMLHYGVIYPMQTFSKERSVDFSQIPVFIEGCDAPTTGLACTIAQAVSGHVQELSSQERRYLHLSAVFACNFANHCYQLAASVLQRHSLPFSVMLPLIDETARKVHSLTPREAQTGPAVRYDESVISAHLQLLSEQPMARSVYELMSKSIHQTQLSDD